MESRCPTEVVVSSPTRSVPLNVALTGARITVGRLPDVNDIALQPDPQQLVTRLAHCTFEREGERWFLIDGGSVNGTFLRRGESLQRVTRRTGLREGDVVCVLAALEDSGGRRFFELAFHSEQDSQATQAAFTKDGTSAAVDMCLKYDVDTARLVLLHDGAREEIQIRAQAHRLVRHMAERNAATGGSPALCTHDELMLAVWAGEPMHTRLEVAKLIWELRRKLAPFHAEQLIESERRLGYRMRTCGE